MKRTLLRARIPHLDCGADVAGNVLVVGCAQAGRDGAGNAIADGLFANCDHGQQPALRNC